MLPWKTTGAVICFSETNFVALLGTAVVVSAAAAIWCTRRRAFTSSASIKATPLNPQTTTTTTTTTPAEVFDPNCSYLCTSCGTEKYTTSSPSNAAAMEQAKGPFKMIILVRTDLNMVIFVLCLMIIIMFCFRGKAKLLLSAVMQFWPLINRLLRVKPNRYVVGNARANQKSL